MGTITVNSILRRCKLQASATFSPDVQSHKMVNISLRQADWAQVCFDQQLPFCKKKPPLKRLRQRLARTRFKAMRRAARLSHDVVMLSGE